MAPRPTPDDSLFAEEKPYLPGRRRSSLLSGLDHNLAADEEVWDDELGGGSSIELTSSSGGCDPLIARLQTDEDVACQHDGEIALLMATQWNAFRKRAATSATPKPLSDRQKFFGGVWFLLVVMALVGLGIYAAQSGLGNGSNGASYQCPTKEHPLDLPSLEQLKQEQLAGNNTSVCRQDAEYCACQNPTGIPLQTKLLEKQLQQETALIQKQNDLDVVFVGQVLEGLLDAEAIWTSHPFQTASIAQEEDLRTSSVLHRFQQGILPSTVQPKVWWISLGQQDLGRDGCSLEAVYSGVSQIVEILLDRQPEAQIVLSPPSGVSSDWIDRLNCVAGRTPDQVQFFDPTTEEEDDDFFMDVSSATSSTASLSLEEAQQAVVDKLTELLH